MTECCCDNNKAYEPILLRFAVLIIIPLFIGIWLFPGEEVPIIFEFNDTTNTTYAKINDSTYAHPSWATAIRSIFSTPFDLSFYRVVIKDEGYKKDDTGCDISWLFEFGTERKILSGGNITTFEMMRVNERYLWEKHANLAVYDAENCKFILSFKVYATPYSSDIIAKRILIIIAWVGLFMLGREAWYWIMNTRKT